MVESPSVKASISGDWGELSMWQAVSAFWYCCRVIWKEVGRGSRELYSQVSSADRLHGMLWKACSEA